MVTKLSGRADRSSSAGRANHHPVSAGTIVAFTTLQTRLYFPIGQLLQVSVELRSSLALFDRVFEYLDMVPDIVDAPDAVDLPVTEAGGRVALVGPSGAGKTTISYLIPRLYDVTAGAVEVDGLDVRHVRQASLAAAIGFVTQETYLFHDTVLANLRYGRPGASREEVEEAARAAYIHDRIMEFPAGYDTVVGERGYRLSGGEKQRLAIARVLLNDPRILILDEATSALDTASEREMQKALDGLMGRARPSPSLTGCPRSSTRTASPSSTAARWWNPARTAICYARAGCTRPCTRSSSKAGRSSGGAPTGTS